MPSKCVISSLIYFGTIKMTKYDINFSKTNLQTKGQIENGRIIIGLIF